MTEGLGEWFACKFELNCFTEARAFADFAGRCFGGHFGDSSLLVIKKEWRCPGPFVKMKAGSEMYLFSRALYNNELPTVAVSRFPS